MNEKKPRRHPLVFSAFIVALVVFILPTHADLMFSAIAARQPAVMTIVTTISFAVVLIPLIAGSVLTTRRPERWCKSRYAIATWVILALALLLNCFEWYRFATGCPTAR